MMLVDGVSMQCIECMHMWGVVHWLVRPGDCRVAEGPQAAVCMHAGLAAGDALLMDSTRLSNTFTCQPQQRNMHGRVFGGFLMRRAYELAFATVHMFAGSRPRFVQVDRVRCAALFSGPPHSILRLGYGTSGTSDS